MKYMDVKKRGWVKNAAIVFLAVMLVLTFFSQTIRNRSLPEVAAQYTTSGTITARIRGSGPVRANESFEVKTNQTRTVSEVPVRLGDEVEIGDVLIRMTGSVSAELETAQNKLHELELTLERKLIELTRPDGTLSNANRDIQRARLNLDEARLAVGRIPYSEAAINQAQNALNQAQAAFNQAQAALSQAQAGLVQPQIALDAAMAVLAEREADVVDARNWLTELLVLNDSSGPIDDEIIDEARVALANAEAARDAARGPVGAAQAAFNQAQAELSHAQAGLVQPQIALDAALAALNEREADVVDARNWLTELLVLNNPPGAIDEDIIEVARQALSDAEDARDAAREPVGIAQAAYNLAREPVDNAQLSVNNASTTIDASQTELNRQEGYRAEWVVANNTVRQLQQTLEDLVSSYSNAQAGAGVDSSLVAIELRELRREIDETREEIKGLEEGGGVSEIKALVGGIIKQVNISPSQQTIPDDVLMVIEVVDRGYSLSISVTTAQASRVNIGDQAEVDRGWYSWGNEITATLINIRNDPQNPATNRILHFNVSGDVESDSHLNITMSQRGENYNVIVPNNAIRTDTNGTFVLVVLSRSSPLGNRYIATRVDVNILASDDTHTAVSGGLSGWDFVITNSTAPIDPGMEVRLVDNP